MHLPCACSMSRCGGLSALRLSAVPVRTARRPRPCLGRGKRRAVRGRRRGDAGWALELYLCSSPDDQLYLSSLEEGSKRGVYGAQSSEQIGFR